MNAFNAIMAKYGLPTIAVPGPVQKAPASVEDHLAALEARFGVEPDPDAEGGDDHGDE